MRIFLVRHGESLGNVDHAIHRTHADHAIPLSDEGHAQAERAGQFLRGWFMDNLSLKWNAQTQTGPRLPRIWVSPYLRTRLTADGMAGALSYERAGRTLPLIRDRRENIALCEQQFGLFDGIPDDELKSRFPEEHAHYAKQEAFEGRFWARMPMGESRWDVAIRVHQVFGTWIRDAEKHHINDLVVVTHGVTLRCIVMRWLHLPVEWVEKEPNPKNCSIRLIEDGIDKGYIHPGG